MLIFWGEFGLFAADPIVCRCNFCSHRISSICGLNELDKLWKIGLTNSFILFVESGNGLFIESTRFSRWIFPVNIRLSAIIIEQHLQLLNQVWWIHHFFYNASNYFENVISLIVIYWRKWTKTKNSEFITKTKMLEFSGKNWVILNLSSQLNSEL